MCRRDNGEEEFVVLLHVVRGSAWIESWLSISETSEVIREDGMGGMAHFAVTQRETSMWNERLP